MRAPKITQNTSCQRFLCDRRVAWLGIYMIHSPTLHVWVSSWPTLRQQTSRKLWLERSDHRTWASWRPKSTPRGFDVLSVAKLCRAALICRLPCCQSRCLALKMSTPCMTHADKISWKRRKDPHPQDKLQYDEGRSAALLPPVQNFLPN